MKKSFLLMFFCFCLACSLFGSAADRAAVIPDFGGKVRFTADGKADEDFWRKAGSITTFSNFYAKVPVTEKLTDVRICMDSENFYVAVLCDEPGDVNPGKAGGSCWSSDNVEIFVGSMGREGEPDEWYRQIVVALNGSRYSEFIKPGEYTAVTSYGENGWCAEVAIPLDKLGPIAQGRLLFNILRRRNALRELHTWQQMQWAHDLDKFGTLVIHTEASDVIHGPWTFGISGTAAGVNWETRGESEGTLFWRARGEGEFQRTDACIFGGVRSRLSRLHPVRLENLRPGTEYEYHIGDGVIRTFRTLDAAPGDFSFVFTADIHGEAHVLQNVLSGKALQGAEMLFLGGDLVTGCIGRAVCYNGFLDAVAEKWNKPCYYVRGNHEYRGGAPEAFFNLIPLPGDRAYDAFTHKGVLFIQLDTDGDVISSGDYFNEERAWMKRLLEGEEFAKAEKVVLVAHAPLWDPELGGGRQLLELYDMMNERQKAKIVLALAGHLHEYAKSVPGSRRFHRPDSAVHGQEMRVNPPFPVIASPKGGYVVVTAAKDKVTSVVYDEQHREIDRIVK